MKFDISIEPMGAVRTTRAMAGRTLAGQRYAAYKESIGWYIRDVMSRAQPLDGPVIVPRIVFRMPIPKSLALKVNEGSLHTKKPDIDNLIKGLFDAANGIAWVDDNRICKIGSIEKVYSHSPGIYFEIEGGNSNGRETGHEFRGI